jgi:hypothetical protein
MSSTIIDDENHRISNKQLDYDSIFKHYGLEKQLQHDDLMNKRSIEISNRYEKNHFRNLYEKKREAMERNASNKKTINARTIDKKTKQPSKNSPTKSKKVCLKSPKI